jgi:hypothetical protein
VVPHQSRPELEFRILESQRHELPKFAPFRLALRRFPQDRIPEADFSGVGRGEPRHGFKQGRLAGPVGAGDDGDAAAVEGDVDRLVAAAQRASVGEGEPEGAADGRWRGNGQGTTLRPGPGAERRRPGFPRRTDSRCFSGCRRRL